MKRAALKIVERLRLHGHEAFFAGGWVRDTLLRRKPKDIDIATSALPEEVSRLFPKSRAIGAQFGVVQVSMYGRPYEVATFRSDSEYADGRHPDSVTFSDPEQDALRRDFTINGLFYDPVADRLIDYVHGKSDIQARLIRTIGEPGARFAEDKLRMLRAIRLACDLDFEIVPETWDAIRKLAPGILQVSWERIRDELTRILSGPAPAAGLDLLQKSGLLQHILPEVEALRGIQHSPNRPEDVYTHTRNALALLHKPSAVLAFATLLHDAGKPVLEPPARDNPPEVHAEKGRQIAEEACRRIRLSNDDTERIADLVRLHVEFSKAGAMRGSFVKRLLRRPDIAEQLELFRVNCLSNHKDLELYSYWVGELEKYRAEAPAPPLISGDDLIALGYAPGPVFRQILESVEDLQLENKIRTREEALTHIKAAFPLPGESGQIPRQS